LRRGIAKQGENHSQARPATDGEILDYAHFEKSKGRERVPISGIISFIAALVQLPWAIFFFFLLIFPKVGGPPMAFSPGDLLIIILILAPLIVSLAYGCYSISIAGISLRNLFGVLGLTLVGAEIIWFGWYTQWTSAAAAWFEVMEVPLLVCVAAGIVVFVSWTLFKYNRRRADD
jgi:hypothetical protein